MCTVIAWSISSRENRSRSHILKYCPSMFFMIVITLIFELWICGSSIGLHAKTPLSCLTVRVIWLYQCFISSRTGWSRPHLVCAYSKLGGIEVKCRNLWHSWSTIVVFSPQCLIPSHRHTIHRKSVTGSDVMISLFLTIKEDGHMLVLRHRRVSC